MAGWRPDLTRECDRCDVECDESSEENLLAESTAASPIPPRRKSGSVHAPYTRDIASQFVTENPVTKTVVDELSVSDPGPGADPRPGFRTGVAHAQIVTVVLSGPYPWTAYSAVPLERLAPSQLAVHQAATGVLSRSAA